MAKDSLYIIRQHITSSVERIESTVTEVKAVFSGELSAEEERSLRSIEGAIRSGIADLKAMANNLWSNVSINLDLDADDEDALGEDEDEDEGEVSERDKALECPVCEHKDMLPVGLPEFYSNTPYGDGEESGGLRLRFMCQGCRRVSKFYLIYSFDGTGTIMRWE